MNIFSTGTSVFQQTLKKTLEPLVTQNDLKQRYFVLFTKSEEFYSLGRIRIWDPDPDPDPVRFRGRIRIWSNMDRIRQH
jgi:hypothetical protein